jgi:hypothetical protein
MHVARESWMGGHGYGITSAITALLDWRKRRKGRTVAESINHDA